MTEALHGSCLCGAIQYQITATPKTLLHCHCSQCRKGHGAAFASYTRVLRDNLQIVQGADSLKSYASSASVLRQFCSHCGSTLFWSRIQGDFCEWISVAAGTLDTPFVPDKQQHVEVASKAYWYDINDDGLHRE